MPSTLKSRSRASAIMAMVATMVLAGFAFAGAATGTGNTEHITVTQELEEGSDEQECAGRDAMTMATSNTAEHYTIVVTVSEPLCHEITASAVIYLMPSATTAWPQNLSEKVGDITLQEAGVTTVMFDKYCVPAQFDLIEGDLTPETIVPLVAEHGPLLFPNNLEGYGGSAIQYQGGGDCTTEPEVPEVPETEPETETVVTVGGSTTVVPGGSNATVVSNGTVAPTVGGTTATSSGGASVSVAG